jgi:hypothetical protein
MPKRPPPSEKLFAEAAELRAAGATWQTVAKAVNRHERIVRGWQRKYAQRWADALLEAERRMTAHSDCEGVLTLRRLLLSADEKIRWHAAKALIARRIDHLKIEVRTLPPPQPRRSSAAAELIALLDEYPDEELTAIAAIAVEPAALPEAPAA